MRTDFIDRLNTAGRKPGGVVCFCEGNLELLCSITFLQSKYALCSAAGNIITKADDSAASHIQFLDTGKAAKRDLRLSI